jgi:HEAT repeat protein
MMKDGKALPPLIAALDDEYASVRVVAAVSLERITGKGYGDDKDKWHEWWQKIQNIPR